MKEKTLHFLEGIKQKVLSYVFRLSSKEKIYFLEQLENLLASWIPITNSLKIISYQTKSKSLKKVVETILDITNKGKWLWESFALFPDTFNEFDLSILEVGEVTGKLDISIGTIRKKEEKSKELTQKIIWALIYPAIIIALSIAMIGVFMIYVIPKIQDMYKDAKVNLPELTQNVLFLSNFLQKNYFELLVWCGICILILKFIQTNAHTRIYFDRFVLKIPLVWTLIKKKILTHFCHTLSTLLSSGVIINKALAIGGGVVQNEYYKKEIYAINKGISEWQELSKLLWIDSISKGKEHELFPIDLSWAVKIWEQTGKLAEAFWRISLKFEKELDGIVKNMQIMIEPLVIVIVWIIVWTLILAIMLPFFNMVNVL